MTPQEVIEHFGTVAAAARALKLKGPSLYGWISDGRIPIDRQCHIEIVTRGALRADRAELNIEGAASGKPAAHEAESVRS